jgi:transposase
MRQLRCWLNLAFRIGDVRRIKRLSALLWFAEDVPVRCIAQRVGVSHTTIYAWIAAFLVDSWASLHPRTSPGRPARLTKSQQQRLGELVRAGPEAAGYATGCWTTILIQDLILREFGVAYSHQYLSELLRNLGFSYQKARFVAAGQDDAAREQWLTQEWPRIVREAHQREALLLFSDEASFAQGGTLGYTWSPTGQQPLVRTSGRRTGYKVFGVMDYFRGQVWYHGSTERFTAASYQAFLEQVLQDTTAPLILIQDNARYHTAKAMQTFFAQHADRLTVYHLPVASPDYNPIEHLWRNVKREKTHNRYFPTFESLVTAVETALAQFQQQPQRVKQLMGTCLDKIAQTTLAALV